ncbi:protein of unknown function [Paraburkholderia kururiensis]|uniref:response regulator transcription factor n=1 Tax=Paraburkholderia kururiensis TaxID=984307 RepID=UPI0039A7049F
MLFAPAVSRSGPQKILSRREVEVLLKLVQGCSVSDIARALGLNIRMVNTHKTGLMQKFHLESSADVIRFAMNNGPVQAAAGKCGTGAAEAPSRVVIEPA